jgi:3-oxoacyl-[acyl-carrier-protein] synthase-3
MAQAYITSWGAFLPGEPVNNDQIEDILGLVNGTPSRVKRRVLKSNGIQTRHYALNDKGETLYLNEQLATRAIQRALSRRGMPLANVQMLAVGTTQGDLPVPGFASMVHGRLGGPPMEILSAGGVCCSSMAAFKAAVTAVRAAEHATAVVCGSEMISRMLKASRFQGEAPTGDPADDDAEYAGVDHDFDAHFLRWTLSDGAGAVLLEDRPREEGRSLRVDWCTLVSHANEFEACMYAGVADKSRPAAGQTWLDYRSLAQAEAARITRLRQDTRILPNIVKLGVEEYLRLMKAGRIVPEAIDHVLCHYSSHFFKGEIVKLLAKAGVQIPEERWFTNLYTKGNTGAASIFIMLEEAMSTGLVKPGQRVLLVVPESGRFTVSFALLTCVDGRGRDDVPASQPVVLPRPAHSRDVSAVSRVDRASVDIDDVLQQSPLGAPADDGDELMRWLSVELALVWADFDRMLRATPILKRMATGTLTVDDYKRLLVNLRQQVVDGARWIARAASNVSADLFQYRSMFITHAGDEHRDFQMIERDFVALGGTLEEIQRTPKNIGSEALSAFMFHRAGHPDPLDLLGAMFIIEGLGATRAHQWAREIKAQLTIPDKAVSFLSYHGVNDDDHFGHLRDIIRSGLITRDIADRIVKTAKVTARLYVLQLEEIDHV